MPATAVGPACSHLSSEVLSRVSEALPAMRWGASYEEGPRPCAPGGGGRGLHTPHTPRPEPPFSVPGIHETVLQFLIRASVASRCPVVPHFFLIERRGFSIG